MTDPQTLVSILTDQLRHSVYAMWAIAFGLVLLAIAVAYLAAAIHQQIAEDRDGSDGDDDPDELPVSYPENVINARAA